MLPTLSLESHRNYADRHSSVQNKDKCKRGQLPADMLDNNRYLAAVTVPGSWSNRLAFSLMANVRTTDVWLCYPWEAT